MTGEQKQQILDLIDEVQHDLKSIETYLFIYRRMIGDEITKSFTETGKAKSKLYDEWEPSAQITSKILKLIAAAAHKHLNFEMPITAKMAFAIENLMNVEPEPETLITDVRAELFRLKLALAENTKPLNEIDEIARKLKGIGSARFKFLANRLRGVSFSEFQLARNPLNNKLLTESDNPDSIKAMLSKLSGELSEHGYEISVSIEKDLICCRKIQTIKR